MWLDPFGLGQELMVSLGETGNEDHIKGGEFLNSRVSISL
jgi:hypothetical protein